MPDNSYLPTLQFQPYVSAVNQEPTKEVDDLGKVLNERYESNIAQFDKFDELAHQLQVSDADQYLKQGLLSDTRNAISNIATGGNWEDAKVPIREIARRFANDPILTKAATNYQTAKKLDELQEQAAIRGESQIRFKDYKNFSTIDPSTGKARDLTMDGVYEKKLDYQQKMNQMFEGLHANASANKTNNMERDPETGQLYQAGSGYSSSGISRKQVVDAANRNFNSYLASGEGQQRLKVLTSRNSENGNPVDTSTALNLMKQELINTGLNKVFHESSTESFTKPDRMPKTSTTTKPDGTTLINDISYQQNEDLKGLINSLDKKKRMGKDAILIPGEGMLPNYAPAVIRNPDSKTTFGYGDIPSNMKDTYNGLKQMISRELGTKDIDKINPVIQKYLKNIQNSKIQPVVAAFNDSKDINNANNFFQNGQYESAEYLDPQTGQKLSWKQIQDKYTNAEGKNLSEKDIEHSKVTGNYSFDNPFYDMTGGDSNFSAPKKVIIGGNSFVLGASVQDKSEPEFEARHLASKITSARRLGLPIKLSHGLTIIPSNNGYLIQQGDNLPRGNAKGEPLSLEDLLSITIPNGVKPE